MLNKGDYVITTPQNIEIHDKLVAALYSATKMINNGTEWLQVEKIEGLRDSLHGQAYEVLEILDFNAYGTSDETYNQYEKDFTVRKVADKRIAIDTPR